MAKRKKTGLWMFGGIMVPAAVLSLWFITTTQREKYVSVPEGWVVTRENEAGWVPGGDGRKVSSGIKPPEAIQYRYIKNCPLSGEIQREIFEICTDANISFELVMALIEKESGFDPGCVSDEGQSVGLMQIQEKWHREVMDKLGCRDLYDPLQNVRVGVELLKRHFETYQDAAAALMAYNGGQAYAEKMLTEGKISDYAESVLEKAEEYERRNGLRGR